jgi:ribonuclease HII
MHNAVLDLCRRLKTTGPDETFCLQVDGNAFQTDWSCAVQRIVRGDQTHQSIACASIIAKVVRDRLVGIYDHIFPQYGLAQHKGYPTRAHKDALKRYGPSPIHRTSFRLT